MPHNGCTARLHSLPNALGQGCRCQFVAAGEIAITCSLKKIHPCGFQSALAAMSAEYDLTRTLLPFLDSHLGVKLLSFLSTTQLFDAADVVKAQYMLASRTEMFDLATQLHKEAFPNDPVPECTYPCANQRSPCARMPLRPRARA